MSDKKHCSYSVQGHKNVFIGIKILLNFDQSNSTHERTLG